MTSNILSRKESFGILVYLQSSDRFYFMQNSEIIRNFFGSKEIINLFGVAHIIEKIIQNDCSKAASIFNFENSDYHLNKPCTITWEITNECNLNCSYCFAKDTSTIDIFDKELINTIIESLEDSGVMRVILTGGEPFMNIDKLLYILDRLSNIQVGIILSSNGTLISEDLAQMIKKYLTSIQISIDGKKETHDAIKGKGCFDQTIESIKICKRNDIFLQVNLVPTKKNISEIMDVAYLCESLGVNRLQIFPLIPRGGGITVYDDLRLDPQEIEKIHDKCLNAKKRNKWNIFIGLSRRHLAKGSCVLIKPNGKVYSPSYDSSDNVYAGDLRNRSLLNIWNESNAFNKKNHLLQVNPYQIICAKSMVAAHPDASYGVFEKIEKPNNKK